MQPRVKAGSSSFHRLTTAHDDILCAQCRHMSNTHACKTGVKLPLYLSNWNTTVTSALPRVMYLLCRIKLHYIPKWNTYKLFWTFKCAAYGFQASPEKHKLLHTHRTRPSSHMLACTNSQTHMLFGGSMESIRCTLEHVLTQHHLFQLSPLVTLKLQPPNSESHHPLTHKPYFSLVSWP